MTVLTHRVLDSQGRPIAGLVATVAPYPGRAGATGTYHRDRATSATSSDDGVLSWVLPPWTGPGVPSYVVSGIEARQVLVAVPRTVSTATVTETRTGTLPLPPGQEPGRDLVTQSELASRLAGITSELGVGGEASDAAFARTQDVAVDARLMPSGPVTSLPVGEFVSSFGNSPARVSGGRIVHTPSGQSNTASYVQARTRGPITRMGCVAYFPDGGTVGSVALVIPIAPWTDAALENAGVHLVAAAGGIIGLARYRTGLEGDLNATVDPLAGGTHTIECVLLYDERRVMVLVDGVRVLSRIDPAAFGLMSDLAVWELYEYEGTAAAPAQLLALWADSDARPVLPPAAPPAAIPAAPPPGRAYAKQVWDANVYPVGLSPAEVSTDLRLPVSFPESGKLLATVSFWVNADGPLYGLVNGQVQQLTASPYSGRLVLTALVDVGGPGPGDLVFEAFQTSGSGGAVVVGGAAGSFVFSAVPLAV